jgi:hypothetical protein
VKPNSRFKIKFARLERCTKRLCDYEGTGRTARGGHGLLKVSTGPAMPYPSTPLLFMPYAYDEECTCVSSRINQLNISISSNIILAQMIVLIGFRLSCDKDSASRLQSSICVSALEESDLIFRAVFHEGYGGSKN